MSNFPPNVPIASWDWHLAIRNSKLKSSEKQVLHSMATYADPQGRCWPSKDTLAADCSMSRRGIQLILRRLEAKGVLLGKLSRGRIATRYTICIEELHRLRTQKVPPQSRISVSPTANFDDTQPRTRVHANGARCAPEPSIHNNPVELSKKLTGELSHA